MGKEFTRREVMGVGIGAAALATAGAVVSTASAAQTATKSSPEKESPVTKLSELNIFGEELETGLVLRTSPIAVKMLEKESDIPKGAFRPVRDGGYHIAQCQAFGMSRREGKTVAMLKEDNWCPTALIAYGIVEKPDSFFGESFMTFETGKYIGIVTAPLKSASFTPDVVMIYMNPAQLRGAIMPLTFGSKEKITTELVLPSCGHAVVDPIKTGNYTLVLPDPGEYQRGLTTEDEMILSIPKQKIQSFMASLKRGGKMYSHRDQFMSMKPDFEQPQFYKDMFKSWGIHTE